MKDNKNLPEIRTLSREYMNSRIAYFSDQKGSKLNSILKGGEKIYPVKNQFVETRKDIVKFYENTVIDAGLEGVIVRCLNGPTYKIKPKITIDGVILGYVVGEGESNDLLKEILVGLCVGENQYTLLTKTGNGFSDNERRELLILLSLIQEEILL